MIRCLRVHLEYTPQCGLRVHKEGSEREQRHQHTRTGERESLPTAPDDSNQALRHLNHLLPPVTPCLPIYLYLPPQPPVSSSYAVFHLPNLSVRQYSLSYFCWSSVNLDSNHQKSRCWEKLRTAGMRSLSNKQHNSISLNIETDDQLRTQTVSLLIILIGNVAQILTGLCAFESSPYFQA